MPNHKTHCAISKKRTGYAFSDLHRWIDEHQKEYGSDHRIKRHAYNKNETKKIKEYWEDKRGKGWGRKAVVEWLFHIALDNLETAFKVSKQVYGLNTYNYIQFGLANSGYIYSDFDRCFDNDLKEIFEFDDDFFEDEFFEEDENFFKDIF
jgi:hypothetical protein